MGSRKRTPERELGWEGGGCKRSLPKENSHLRSPRELLGRGEGGGLVANSVCN